MAYCASISDYALVNHVVATHKVTCALDCTHACLEDNRCISFNYQYATTDVTHQCELNDHVNTSSPVDYVARANFSYYKPLMSEVRYSVGTLTRIAFALKTKTKKERKKTHQERYREPTKRHSPETHLPSIQLNLDCFRGCSDLRGINYFPAFSLGAS